MKAGGTKGAHGNPSRQKAAAGGAVGDRAAEAGGRAEESLLTGPDEAAEVGPRMADQPLDPTSTPVFPLLAGHREMGVVSASTLLGHR